MARISLQPAERSPGRSSETTWLDGAVAGESTGGGVEAAAKGIGGMFGKR